jgi:mono/diheme cytochrome c family protein
LSSVAFLGIGTALAAVIGGGASLASTVGSPGGDPIAAPADDAGRGSSSGAAREAQLLRGRVLTINHACGGCHGAGANPAAAGFLAGLMTPDQEFLIGACATKPGATPCFRTRPRNLTPDNATGLGRFSERQIFNALRYGLRPGETPDVEITSSVPGKGNFPMNPKYLAPPMPWPEWRHMADQELWDIAAYLKHGLRPVRNRVPDSEGPPDFWASVYTPDKIGPYPLPPFPTARERQPE